MGVGIQDIVFTISLVPGQPALEIRIVNHYQPCQATQRMPLINHKWQRNEKKPKGSQGTNTLIRFFHVLPLCRLENAIAFTATDARDLWSKWERSWGSSDPLAGRWRLTPQRHSLWENGTRQTPQSSKEMKCSLYLSDCECPRLWNCSYFHCICELTSSVSVTNEQKESWSCLQWANSELTKLRGALLDWVHQWWRDYLLG